MDIRQKFPGELRSQFESVQARLNTEQGESLVSSTEGEQIMKMSEKELKEKYPRRYELYLELLRREWGAVEEAKSNEKIEKLKKWLRVLNSLDDYIKNHQEGRETTLYERQATVFDDVRKFLEAGGSEGYVKMPTGSGKTVLFSELVEAIDLPTLIVVPRKLLIKQTQEKLEQFAPGLDVGEISGKAKQFGRQVTVTTYDSLLSQLEQGNLVPADFDFLILDEVHLALSQMRMEAIKKFEDTIKIGFTATPVYSQKKKVENILGTEIHNLSIREAVEKEGLLSPFSSILAYTEVDLSTFPLGTVDGDYDESTLAKALNIAGRNRSAVDLYKQNFLEESAVCYCVGVDHAGEMVRLFNEVGIPAEMVSGKTRNLEEILAKYKNGEIKVLCNADLLIAGFDAPITSVCLNLRPTASVVMAEQRAGRALRPDPENLDKYAHIVDFVDKGIPNERGPVLFASVADGVKFENRRNEPNDPSCKFGEGVDRPPILSVPGLLVVTEVEEIMKFVLKIDEAKKAAEPRTQDLALKEFEEAFTKWQDSPVESRGIFNNQWLIKNGYNALYVWAKRHTKMAELVKLSCNEPLRQLFAVPEQSRTQETAIVELEQAFAVWQSLPKENRGKFNTSWLIENGYSALYEWAKNNIKLPELVKLSDNGQLKQCFAFLEMHDRTRESSIIELEQAFALWQSLQEKSEKKFNDKWLRDNGYGGLSQWAFENIKLSELVKISKNEQLKKCFAYQKIIKRTPESALKELEQAFEIWLSQPEKGRRFNQRWLRDNGYNGLNGWQKEHIELSKLAKQSKNVGLQQIFDQ